MKVLVVGPNIFDTLKLGGVSTYVRFLLSNLSVDYEYFVRTGSHRSIINSFQIFIQFKRKIEARDLDIIHINTALSPFAIYRDFILLCLIGKRKKIIIQIHGGRYLNSKPPLLLQFIIGKLLNNQKIIVLSELEKQQIVKNYNPSSVYVLRNAVTIDFPEEITSKREIKSLKNPISMIYLGRIDKNKGLDYLLESLVQLQSQNIEFQFVLYGDGDYKNIIVDKFERSLESRSFYYGGVITGDDKMLKLVDADIFILPSLFEGLPIALLEAMSVGRIVLATNVGSIPSVVRNEENGFLVDPEDSTQLYNKLIQIVNHDRINEISKAAFETIKDYFNAEYFKKKIIEIYAEV